MLLKCGYGNRHREENVELINKTPHDITILNEDGEVVRVIGPTGEAWRLQEEVHFSHYEDGVPVTESRYTCIDLPPEKENVAYIVSQLFINSYPHRRDLRVPAQVIRTGSKIMGCLSLGRLPKGE